MWRRGSTRSGTCLLERARGTWAKRGAFVVVDLVARRKEIHSFLFDFSFREHRRVGVGRDEAPTDSIVGFGRRRVTVTIC